jgi:hypothetical protein
MEALFLDTVQEYCKTINSLEESKMFEFQESYVIFFSSLLKELQPSKEIADTALQITNDLSTRVSTGFFQLLFSTKYPFLMIRAYRNLLKQQLTTALKNVVK